MKRPGPVKAYLIDIEGVLVSSNQRVVIVVRAVELEGVVAYLSEQEGLGEGDCRVQA